MRKLTALVIASLFIVQMQAQEGKKIVAYSPVKPVFIDGVKGSSKEPAKIVVDIQDKTKPSIQIIGFNANKAYKSPYTLRGRVTDQSQLDDVTVNNFKVSTDADGNFEIQIPLTAKQTKVEVLADDIHHNKASETIYITRIEGPTLKKHTKDYLLLFAVSQNDDASWDNLGNKLETNVKAFAGLLEEKYGFSTEIVWNPTYEQIEKKLNDYKGSFESGRRDKEGQLLVMFSGHGEKGMGSNAYFIPKDGQKRTLHRTALPYNVLVPWVNTMQVKHSMLYVDACYSAYLDQNYAKTMAGNPWAKPKETKEQMKLKIHQKRKTRKFLTSDSEGNYTPNPSRLLRVFTQALRENEKELLEMKEIWIDNMVDKITPKPHSGNFDENDQDASFIFVKRK